MIDRNSQLKIMKEFQQNHHSTAASDFLHSLNQLEKILQAKEDEEINASQETEKQTNQEKKPTSNSSGADIATWEEAVADIEQYLQENLPDKTQ